MRTHKIFLKSTTLTAIFLAVFVMGSFAQTSNDQDREDRDKRDKITQAVSSTTPSDGDKDVERGTVIEITLDEEMELDQETIQNSTFVLKGKKSDGERERGQEMRRDQQDDMQQDQDWEQEQNQDQEQDDMEYENEDMKSDHVMSDHKSQRDQYSQDSSEDMKTIEGTVEVDNNTVRFIPNQTLRAHTEYVLTMNTETAGMNGADLQQDWQQQGQEQDWDQEEDQNNEDWEQEQTQQDQTQRAQRSQQDRTMAHTQQNQEWSVTFTTGGRDEPLEMVDLGSAGNYVVLANAIHNETTSDISGELGKVEEGERDDEERGMRDDRTTQADTTDNDNGSGLFTDDDQARSSTDDHNQAIEDLRAAYEQLEQLQNPDFEDVFEGEISGKVLTPGLYKWNSSVEIDSVVTLSGNAEDVWVFQISDDLNINEDVEIQLENGAVPENIFWQVSGEVALKSGAHAEGVLLTMNEINLENGASVNGRMLAVNDISLDQNVITQPDMFRADRRTGRTGPEGN